MLYVFLWRAGLVAAALLVVTVALAACRLAGLVDDDDERRCRLVDPPTCRCHHALDAHVHLRSGLDCGLCGCRDYVGVDVAAARGREVPVRPVLDPDPLYDQALADEQWQRWDAQVES